MSSVSGRLCAARTRFNRFDSSSSLPASYLHGLCCKSMHAIRPAASQCESDVAPQHQRTLIKASCDDQGVITASKGVSHPQGLTATLAPGGCTAQTAQNPAFLQYINAFWAAALPSKRGIGSEATLRS
jgi:hypothetical protein